MLQEFHPFLSDLVPVAIFWVKRLHQGREMMKYYKKYFKPFSDTYTSETLSLADGTKNMFRLSVIL